jgi:hypothetical protein
VLTNFCTLAQFIQHECDPGESPILSGRREQSLDLESSSFTMLKTQPSKNLDTYHSIAPSQRFQWFITGTFGPSHLAGVAFLAAGGTAVNRPPEYGPHWSGVADRLGMGVAGSAVSNAVEASVGILFREDPRYLPESQQSFGARIGKVARMTFLARVSEGRLRPAYARYLGVIGSNFLSNIWRVPSEASAQSALLRSSQGVAGRMAANAFAEFWPDVKRHIFHQRNYLQQATKHAD